MASQPDLLFGLLAVRNGFAGVDDIERALARQRELDLHGHGPVRLGEILLQMGKLQPKHVEALLEAQERLRQPSESESTDPDAETREMPVVDRPASPAEVSAWIIEETPDGIIRAYPLAEKTILGRQPGLDIPVPDMAASRNHARVDFSPYTCKHVLADVGSRNGTYVNDEKLSHPRALRPGDRIRIGGTNLRYAVGAGIDLSRGGTDTVRAAPSDLEETDAVAKAPPPAGLHRERLGVAAAAAVGLAATFLPWSPGRLGVQGPGWATFLLFGLAAVLAFFQDRAQPVGKETRLALTAAGALSVLVGFWRGFRLPEGASPGAGILVAILAGAGVAACAWAWKRR